MAQWSNRINAKLSRFPDTIHLQDQYGTEAAQSLRLLILGVESVFPALYNRNVLQLD